eukprot:1158123-Pelagomonas_calceolata.AAC.4
MESPQSPAGPIASALPSDLKLLPQSSTSNCTWIEVAHSSQRIITMHGSPSEKDTLHVSKYVSLQGVQPA